MTNRQFESGETVRLGVYRRNEERKKLEVKSTAVIVSEPLALVVSAVRAISTSDHTYSPVLWSHIQEDPIPD